MSPILASPHIQKSDKILHGYSWHSPACGYATLGKRDPGTGERATVQDEAKDSGARGKSRSKASKESGDMHCKSV